MKQIIWPSLLQTYINLVAPLLGLELIFTLHIVNPGSCTINTS